LRERCAPRAGLRPKRPKPSDTKSQCGNTGEFSDKLLVSTKVSAFETTLLIHPCVLGAFLDYNDFLGAGERLIEELGQQGRIQLARFHPGYQFAGAEPGAAENYTNRSPYPMLHLLREESISAVAGDPGELLEIPRRNVESLRTLGLEKILEKLKAIENGTQWQA
jgi:uncharacterized protein